MEHIFMWIFLIPQPTGNVFIWDFDLIFSVFTFLFLISTRSILPLSATLAKSGPLDFPSEKSFLLLFAHEKGLGHMFHKSFSCSAILFFCVATSQK